MNDILGAIFRRRAVKAFESMEIPQGLREQVLNAARHAPSSFNTQPYRLFWVESPDGKAAAAKLCLGQMPAQTASALVVAVADIGSLSATSQSQLEWMRSNGFSDEKLRDYERTAKLGRIIFMPGPLGGDDSFTQLTPTIKSVLLLSRRIAALADCLQREM